MKRYQIGMDGDMERHDDGDWVLGDDAEAEADRLRAEVKRMLPVVEAARAWHHEPAGADTRFVFAITDAVAAYEAALAGEKEGGRG